jgi:hypothetical protein
MVSKKQLIEVAESAIDNLVTTFKKSPHLFYTESDLHCYLYSEILNKLPLEDWQCKTKEGKSSILLHKEYPTKERYSAKALKEKVPKGARGHFDLSIWNPEQTKERLFRAARSKDFENEQHTFIAIEFDLIEGNDSLDQAVHHFKWDLLKLRSTKNGVEHGYALVFVRDWAHRDNFLEEIEKEVANEQRITVLYAEKKGNDRIVGRLSKKPFLNYELPFK